MKKILVCILALFLLAGCYQPTNKLITRNADKVKEMFDNKETFIVYVGTSECENCKEYREIVIKVIEKYHIDVIYMPLDDPERKETIDNLTYDYFSYFLEWTPTTFLVRDGNVISVIEKTIEYTDLVDWLNEHGYIEK